MWWLFKMLFGRKNCAWCFHQKETWWEKKVLNTDWCTDFLIKHKWWFKIWSHYNYFIGCIGIPVCRFLHKWETCDKNCTH